jgi:hypothetical protein
MARPGSGDGQNALAGVPAASPAVLSPHPAPLASPPSALAAAPPLAPARRRRTSVADTLTVASAAARLTARQLRGLRHGLAEEHMVRVVTGEDLRDLPAAAAAAAAWRAVSRRAAHPTLAPWRLDLGRRLEAHGVHLFVLFLIVLDVIAVFGEVMLVHVCPAPAPESPGAARVEAWDAGLGWVSRAIVIALLAYTLLLLVAFGLSFFTKWAYVLDLAVLTTALALELQHVDREHGGGDETGLIAVLLSWRVIRILHGVVATAESQDSEFHAMKARVQALEEELDHAKPGWRAAHHHPGGGGHGGHGVTGHGASAGSPASLTASPHGADTVTAV